jgi:hypothetical protein
MAVLILARGESLSKINELKDKPIELCILINRFNLELQDKNLFDFLKDKEIIHIVSNQHNPSCILTERNYKKLQLLLLFKLFYTNFVLRVKTQALKIKSFGLNYFSYHHLNCFFQKKF